MLEAHKFLASLYASSSTTQTAPALLQALSQKPRSNTVLNALSGYFMLLNLTLDSEQLNVLATSIVAYVNKLSDEYRDNLLMQMAISIGMNRNENVRRGCTFLSRLFREKTYGMSKEVQSLLEQILNATDGHPNDALIRVCPLIPFNCSVEGFPAALQGILDRKNQTYPTDISSDRRRRQKLNSHKSPPREEADFEEVEFNLSPKLSLPSKETSSPRKLLTMLKRDHSAEAIEGRKESAPQPRAEKRRAKQNSRQRDQASASPNIVVHQELLQHKNSNKNTFKSSSQHNLNFDSAKHPRVHTFGQPTDSSEGGSSQQSLEVVTKHTHNHKHPSYPLDYEELAKHERIKKRFSELNHLNPEITSLLTNTPPPASTPQPVYQHKLFNDPTVECIENFILYEQRNDIIKVHESFRTIHTKPNKLRLVVNVLDICMYYLGVKEGTFGPNVRIVLQTMSEYITGMMRLTDRTEPRIAGVAIQRRSSRKQHFEDTRLPQAAVDSG